MGHQKRVWLFAGVAGIAFALLVVSVALAASVVIDDFTVLQYPTIIVDDPANLPITTWNSVDAGLGGQRDMGLTVISGTTDDRARWRTGYGLDSDILSLREGPSVAAIAEIQWDGSADPDPGVLDCATGIGGYDLTGGGTNAGIAIRVVYSKRNAPLTIGLYTDCSNYALRTINLPDRINTDQVVDIFLPFSTFSGGAGTLNPASINAIDLTLDATGYPGSDFQFKLIQATSIYDFGDLPNSGSVAYDSSITNASHIPEGLRLGYNVDAEPSSNPDVYALGDDDQGTPNDEDGVSRDPTTEWTIGANVNLLVTVLGCDGTCYFNGWIDWNRDGDFADPNEQVFNDNTISNGINRVRSLTVPSSGYIQGDDVYARFRICPGSGECNTVTATNVVNGEVEDYDWVFGPTSVTLTSITAHANGTLPALALAGLALLALATTGLFTWRQRVRNR